MVLSSTLKVFRPSFAPPLLGPIHTRAKRRDHEILRAQRKCPKAVPKHLQIHVVWSRTLKCSVKPYMTTSSTKCHFNNIYSCGSSHMIKQNKSMVLSIWSAIVSRFCVKPTSKRWFFNIVQMPMKHDLFDAMQDSMQTLHPSCMVPRAQCEANLDQLCLFPQ